MLPIVIYHGAAKWTATNELSELLAPPPGLERWALAGEFRLIDLGALEDGDLRGDALGRASLLGMKYIRRNQLTDRLPEILRLIRSLIAEPRGLECLRLVLNYVMRATDRIERPVLQELVVQTFPDLPNAMPTIAEELIAEGRQQGIEQGIDRGTLIGQVQLLEEMNGRPATETSMLAQSDTDALKARISELRRRLQG